MRLFFGVLLAITACDSGPESGSESHFLERCDGDRCESGLECICGVCTRACTASSACADLDPPAMCGAVGAIGGPFECGGAPPSTSVCGLASGSDAGRPDTGVDARPDRMGPTPECPATLPTQGSLCPLGVGQCNYGEQICFCNGIPNCNPDCGPDGNWDCNFDGSVLAEVVSITGSRLQFDCTAGSTGYDATGELEFAFTGRDEDLPLSLSEPSFEITIAGKPDVTYFHGLEDSTVDVPAGSMTTAVHPLAPSSGRSDVMWRPCEYCGASYVVHLAPGRTDVPSSGGADLTHSGTVDCTR